MFLTVSDVHRTARSGGLEFRINAGLDDVPLSNHAESMKTRMHRFESFLQNIDVDPQSLKLTSAVNLRNSS